MTSPTVPRRGSEDGHYRNTGGSVSPHAAYGGHADPMGSSSYHGYSNDGYNSAIDGVAVAPDSYDAGIEPMGDDSRVQEPGMKDLCGSKANGNPPSGVTKCVSCGTENSPEWRKGEGGVKNLCNA